MLENMFPAHFLQDLEFIAAIEARKQYRLLDTIVTYILYFGTPGTYLRLSPTIHYAGRHVIYFIDSDIRIICFPGGPK